MVNRYGRQAMEHWERFAPSRVRAITDPLGFFSELGSQVEAAVVELAVELEGPSPPTVSYLDRVGRMRMARMRAEEMVLADLVWIEDLELPLVELREEWELTRTPDEWLAGWADRIQDATYPEWGTAEIEQLAEDWALPVSFLEELLEAEIPSQFLRENKDLLAKAADIRFNREHG